MQIKNFNPRPYQLSILNTCKEKNTLVCLPTGTGKTKIGILLAIERLNKFENSKVLVLTPTKPLASQICKEFQECTDINKNEIILLTGSILPEKRTEYYTKSRVIVATPQTINEDLLSSRANLNEHSLLIVDECITGDSQIKMGDGSEIRIEDLYKLEDNNLFAYSLNEESGEIEPAKILRVHRIKNNKKIIQLKTKENKIIRVTEDHLLLRYDKNWIESKKIDIGNKIAALPKTSKITNNKTIINKNQILETFTKKQKEFANNYENAIKLRIKNLSSKKIAEKLKVNENSIKNYIYKPYNKPVAIKIIEELYKLDFLPLRYSNSKTRIIARIVGHIFGDGWYSKKNNQPYSIGFSGKVEDLKRIQKDLSVLNIKYAKIYSRKTKSTVNQMDYGLRTVNGTSNSFQVTDRKLIRIVEALKIPYGRKADKNVIIPSWIIKSPKLIKCEFLSALMGSEADEPSFKENTRQCRVIRMSFYKSNNLIANGKYYANKIKLLLKEFKINCTISIKKGNYRKNKDNTIKFLMTIGNSSDNIIRFFKIINYTYNTEKRRKGFLALKYLLDKKDKLEKREKYFRKAKSLKKYGVSYKEISKRLGINYNIINNWLSTKIEPNHSSNELEPYNQWIKKNKDYYGVEWAEINEITLGKKEEYVYDLTIERNHNYIANNLIVHNCHRSKENYANTKVAKFYIEQSKFPRVLGLTASPSSDKVEIDLICSNLNVEAVEIRSETDDDLKEFIQKKDVEIINVDFPEEFKSIHSLLKGEYIIKLENLRSFGLTKPLSIVNKTDLIMMQKRLHVEIQKKNNSAFYGISLVSYLLKLSYAMELLETQSLNSLNQFFIQLKTDTSKAAKAIITNEKIKTAINLTEDLLKKGVKHPKIIKLKEIIELELENNQSYRAIVFANYRNTVVEIVEELNKNKIKATKFVGQADRKDKGLKQKEQIEIIEQFKNNEFSILVASSVAEEGLDIPEVNAVIFYEPIGSELRKIQRQGRTGRTKPGKVIFLITKGTRDVGQYYSSLRKEKKMRNTLNKIQARGNLQDYV